MDAATAAKDRVDRALALLQRRLLDLKSRAAAATGPASEDADLFAPQPSTETDRARIRELEIAGQDAAQALARAADVIRDTLAERDGA